MIPSLQLIRAPDERVAVRCPVCGDAGPHPVHLHAVIDSDGAFTFLRCAACDSRINPGAMLPERSDWLAMPAAQAMRLELDGPAWDDIALLLRAGPGRRLLHLGCGFGWAVDFARRVLRWQAEGFDPGMAADEGSLHLGPSIQQDLPPPHALPPGPFDLVLITGVLELYEDAGTLLAAVAGRLAPGGQVIATTRDGAAAVITGHDSVDVMNVVCGYVQSLPTAEGLRRAMAGAGLRGGAEEAAAGQLTMLAGDRSFAPPAPVPPLQRRAYLSALVQQAPPGPLWFGAAGQLLSLLAETEEAAARALFAMIEGVDAAEPPYNHAAMLFVRAGLENRQPGRSPDAVLPWVRHAYASALALAARAQRFGLDPAPLFATARDARAALLMLLAEIAPEVEVDMAAAMALPTGRPEDAMRLPPPETRIRTLTPLLLRAVRAGRLWEARRLDHAFADAGAVAAALDGPVLADVQAALATLRA